VFPKQSLTSPQLFFWGGGGGINNGQNENCHAYWMAALDIKMTKDTNYTWLFGKGVHEADCSDEPENLRNANNTTEKYYPSDSWEKKM